MHIFGVSFKTQQYLMGEGSQWLVEYSAEVTATHSDGVEESELVIGKGKFFYADMDGAYVDGLSPFDVLDERAGTFDFVFPLFGESDEGMSFKSDVTERFNLTGHTNNLFIIDRLEVLPEYRGENVAAILIDEAIRLFSADAEVIALKSFPLQDEHVYESKKRDSWYKAMKMDELPKLEGYEEKLSSFYEKIGFASIGENGIMIRVR